MKKKQPTSTHCFVCGRENPYGLHLEFYDTAPGETTAEVTISEQFQSYPGIVHGGILAAMLDEVTGRVFMQENPNRFLVTAKLDMRYRKPAPVGVLLTVQGHAVRDTGRVAQAIGEIRDPEGNILVEAEAYYVEPPAGTFAGGDASEWGWMVVEDKEETQ
jgi:uncharacterized protein (TIGR00369 family)